MNFDFNTYIATGYPASVAAYVNGSYDTNPVAGRTTLAWSVPWPGIDSRTRHETLAYEQKMFDLAKAAITAFENFQAGTNAFKKITDVSKDLTDFRKYLVIRNQDIDDEFTMNSSIKADNEMWGDWDTKRKVEKWFDEQTSESMRALLDEARIFQADAVSGFASAKIAFYRNKVIPLKNKFSSSDQQFLRDVFLFKTDGNVSLDDLVKALKMLKPYLSFADLNSVLMFSYTMILGSDMSSNVLNTDSDKAYYERNIAKEVAEITAKYSSLASRLGSWLKPETGSLFLERLNIHKLAYSNPNDPRYYICGDVCRTISQNFINAVTDAVTSVIGGSSIQNAQTAKAITESVEKKIQEFVTKGVSSAMTQEQAIELGKKFAAEAQTEANNSVRAQAISKGGFSGFFPFLLGGAALWLLFKEKEK